MILPSIPTDAFARTLNPETSLALGSAPVSATSYTGVLRNRVANTLSAYMYAPDGVVIGAGALASAVQITQSSVTITPPLSVTSVSTAAPIDTPGITRGGSSIVYAAGAWQVQNAPLSFPLPDGSAYSLGVRDGRFVIVHAGAQGETTLAQLFP